MHEGEGSDDEYADEYVRGWEDIVFVARTLRPYASLEWSDKERQLRELP
jgi:hypothetical protein